LHVLGTPPAFVLSQDQTLVFNPSGPSLPLSSSNPVSRSKNQLSFLRFSSLYRFQGPRLPLSRVPNEYITPFEP
jgi:hypothetical protein